MSDARSATRPRPDRSRRRWVALGASALVAGLGCTGVALGGTGIAGNTAEHASMSGRAYWAAVGGTGFQYSGVTRKYYIGADVVHWNYAPRGKNMITGKPFDDVANTWVQSGPGRIGSTYDKCLYRAYTDGTFQHRLPRPRSEAYMGMLGPAIRAEVGDKITVVFRNSCPFPASIHVHGLFYSKASEGAPYRDLAPTAKLDDAVAQGAKYTYHWEVPGRAGPGPDDGSSVMWMYHSHTDEVADTYAGLMGPLVVTGRGLARPDGSPKDVDREMFAVFSVMDENQSPFLDENAQKYEQPFQPPDDGFAKSNLMYSINGYVYGNQPLPTIKVGRHVRWYVMDMGGEHDLHTPHWHGNVVTVGGMRMDVLVLLPATMTIADMVPDDAGIWLFHCHVNEHLIGGMLTRYNVIPKG
jgi:FtsP/CotA-like multicopper oxidase with cupredoxin domain